MHPRVAVSGLCFPELPAVEALEAIADLGVTKASMTATKVREAGAEAVLDASRRSGVSLVATTAAIGLDLSAGADLGAQLGRARADVDLAAAVGAKTAYGLTGRRPVPDWDASAEAYSAAIAELVAYAAARDVRLCVEPASWLYADLSFVHTFHDGVRLARRSGMGICLDLFHCWTEGDLRNDIRENLDAISHVQLGDMVFGDRALPCRAVPGEGDLPLEAAVEWLLEAGYDGVFDLEISGPRVDEIGHREAASRGVAWLEQLLAELGV